MRCDVTSRVCFGGRRPSQLCRGGFGGDFPDEDKRQKVSCPELFSPRIYNSTETQAGQNGTVYKERATPRELARIVIFVL